MMAVGAAVPPVGGSFVNLMDARIQCALCFNSTERFDERIPFTDAEDIVIVRCKSCKRMVYARRESRVIEPAKWRASNA